MPRPKKETRRHREAFDIYLSLGHTRSLAEVGRRIGVTKQAAEGWSAAFGWAERIAERETVIADKVSAKVESDLAKMAARQISTAQFVQMLFQKRIKKAVDKDGNLVPGEYQPSAMDAARWAEIEKDLHSLGSFSSVSPQGIDMSSFDGMTEEKIERIIIERIARVRRFRSEESQ